MPNTPRPPAVAVVELDDATRRALARRHPELAARGASSLVVMSSPELHDQVAAAIRKLADATNESRRVELEGLIDDLMADTDIVPADVADEARRQSRLRTRVLRDFGALSPTEVADGGGSTAANRAQLAYRWRKAGRIFAVSFQGESWYLRFQFDERGRPLPVVAEVLRLLEGWDPWDIATWFVTPNGLLDRQLPVTVLRESPDALVEAAKAAGRGIFTES